METLIGKILYSEPDLPTYMVYMTHFGKFNGVGFLTKSSAAGEGFITLLPYLCSKISAKEMGNILGMYDVEFKTGVFARNIDDIDIDWMNVWTMKDFVQKIRRDFNVEELIDKYDIEETRLSLNGDSTHDPSVTIRQLDTEIDMYMAGRL
jgi:hypothetical protein